MIQALLIIVLGFFIFASPAFAVSVTISNTPSTVTDQSFTFDVSLSCSGCSPSYLRANLFPTGTEKYFGFTYNGSSFVNSSTCSDYLPVTVDPSGNWNGTIQAKIDTSSSYYFGPGNYSLKVRRYTQSCSSYTWSNEATLAVNLATPEPTASPTQSPSPSSTSSSSFTSSFNISGVPSQISTDQSFNASIELSLPNNPDTSYYLLGAFKIVDGTRYFGLTKVNSNWIPYSENFLNQYKITTNSSGVWSGNLEVKPDATDSDYKGTGDYIFKVGRYTSLGSGPTWSNEATLKITGSSNSSTSSNSSSSPKSSSTPPSTKSTGNTTSAKSTSKSSSNANYNIASIAGVSASFSATPSADVEVAANKQFNFIPWLGGIFILAGISSLIFIYLRAKRSP